jgi:hypothetical protein
MKKKKKELPMCSKDLDNPTYGLFEKPGRYKGATAVHLLKSNALQSFGF